MQKTFFLVLASAALVVAGDAYGSRNASVVHAAAQEISAETYVPAHGNVPKFMVHW